MKNLLRRYHNEIYFPPRTPELILEFVQAVNTKPIGYTHHAKDEQTDDKAVPHVGNADLFNDRNTIVEFYEIMDSDNNPTGKIQKLVVKAHHLSEKYDYTYVIAREGFVVTNWANSKSDKHKLKISRKFYYSPQNQIEPAEVIV